MIVIFVNLIHKSHSHSVNQMSNEVALKNSMNGLHKQSAVARNYPIKKNVGTTAEPKLLKQHPLWFEIHITFLVDE